MLRERCHILLIAHTTAATSRGRPPRRSGKPRGVHQRRASHPLAQRRPQVAQTRQIAEPIPRRFAHTCSQSRATNSGKPRFDKMLSPPRPTAVWPGQAHHRHSHPQGIAGRGAATVGERVQGHVDPLVNAEILRRGQEVDKCHPLGPRCLARPENPAPGRDGCRRGMQEQPRPGHRCSSRPQAASTGGVTLQKLFRRAEGDMSRRPRRAGH